MMETVNRAARAHERVMLNLAVFHLLLPVAAFSSGHLLIVLSLALLGSLLLMGSVFYQAKFGSINDAFTRQHWQLAWRRCRLLLAAYLAAALIMGFGYWIASMQSDANMQMIELVVFSRIAAVPIIVMVLVLFVLEMSALAEARTGQAS
jgi:hypothetical protein